MGNLPQIEAIRKIPLTIHRQPYLMDHRFEGSAVFPAVEAMQMLASSTRECCPEANIHVIQNARFDKFLMMSEKQDTIPVFHELCRKDDGMLESRLVTRITSKKLAISRQKEHVSLCFSTEQPPEPKWPSIETLLSLSGDVFTVSSRDVYRELVPFGPSYHNITGDLLITEQGAVATLDAPAHDAAVDPVGSPFPVDAAFHAACVWSQRFLGFIGFPVGFAGRTIFRPTEPGQKYTTRIIPVETNHELMVCDLWIWNSEGIFCEAVSGLRMKDVTSGRKKPPSWIQAAAQHSGEGGPS